MSAPILFNSAQQKDHRQVILFGASRSSDMTPAQKAANLYKQEECPRSFREDLEAHLIGGYVFSTPDFFAMGRPVCSTADHADIINPWRTFPEASWDCWFVYLVAGDMRKAWQTFPFPLEKIAFEKRNKLRYYRFQILDTHLFREAGSESNPLKTTHDRSTPRIPS